MCWQAHSCVTFVSATTSVRTLPAQRREGGWSLPVWWSIYLREQGVRPAGDDWRPAREFRHAWTTAARDSGIPRESAEYIQGHQATGGSAHELYGSRHPLGRRIHDISFRDLDLSKVRPWSKKDMAAG